MLAIALQSAVVGIVVALIGKGCQATGTPTEQNNAWLLLFLFLNARFLSRGFLLYLCAMLASLAGWLVALVVLQHVSPGPPL